LEKLTLYIWREAAVANAPSADEANSGVYTGGQGDGSPKFQAGAVMQ